MSEQVVVVTLVVNGIEHRVQTSIRETLLDLLRGPAGAEKRQEGV